MRSNTGRFQMWLILFLIALALVLGLVILGLLRERRATDQSSQGAIAGASVPASAAGGAGVSGEQVQGPSSSTFPTPTFVPVEAVVPAAEPTVAVVPSSELQPIPVPAPTPVPIIAAGATARLDDNAWQGGYRSARGYGGRSATWIYGTGTPYSTMQARVVLETQPRGTAVLAIEGMDSEDQAKTAIQITVNDVEIFNGPNPLPNDDIPLKTGTWSDAVFRFNAAILRPGTNVIRISNLKPGRFSLPPFFMLDYAVLSVDT